MMIICISKYKVHIGWMCSWAVQFLSIKEYNIILEAH